MRRNGGTVNYQMRKTVNLIWLQSRPPAAFLALKKWVYFWANIDVVAKTRDVCKEQFCSSLFTRLVKQLFPLYMTRYKS